MARGRERRHGGNPLRAASTTPRYPNTLLLAPDSGSSVIHVRSARIRAIIRYRKRRYHGLAAVHSFGPQHSRWEAGREGHAALGRVHPRTFRRRMDGRASVGELSDAYI